jgi:hypothetical protein
MNSQLKKTESHTTLKISLGTLVTDHSERRSCTHLQQQIDPSRSNEYQWRRGGGLVESVDTQCQRNNGANVCCINVGLAQLIYSIIVNANGQL